jgi:hypothetical protein
MAVDIEDAIAYFLATNNPLSVVRRIDWPTCVRPVSSFGNILPEFKFDLDRELAPDMSEEFHAAEIEKKYDFWMKCGRDLNNGKVK